MSHPARTVARERPPNKRHSLVKHDSLKVRRIRLILSSRVVENALSRVFESMGGASARETPSVMLKGRSFGSATQSVKRCLVRAIRKTGYQLVNLQRLYEFDGLHTVHHARFREERRFRAALDGSLGVTGRVDPASYWRLHIGLWAAAAAAPVEGAFVECGVNAGFFSSAALRYLDWNALHKRFYLVDTFSGPVISQYSPEEISLGRRDAAERSIAAGAYITEMDAIRRRYEGWNGVVIVKGVIPEILPSIEAERIAFLHLDMNCAFPECETLKFFWQRISDGGIVLLDDYAYFGYEALGNALESTARTIGASILTLPTGQGMILKATKH